MKILVIETDNGTNVAKMVKRLGYEVTHIDTQQQIFDCLTKQLFDLILIHSEPLANEMMIKAIWDQQQRQGQIPIPMIMLTTPFTSEHYPLIDEVIFKPFHLNTLKTVLTRWALTRPTLNQTAPVLDHQLLKQLNETMGPETTLLLVQQFMEYAPQQLTHLRQIALTGDSVALRGKAHQLKGESLQMGAMQVGALCHQLETLAQGGQINLILECLAQLETAVTQANGALSQVSGND